MQKLKTVYHLSDIHIHLNGRLKEYSKVFSAVCNRIKADNSQDAVIVLTGDIINTKATLSPEMLYQVISFLTELSEIHPVYVIAGNHDGILQARSRLDAITPIVKALDGKDITYWRQTGIYPVADCDFVVDSLLDDECLPEIVQDGRTKIVCYHNTIANSSNGNGFIFNGPQYKSLKEFDGADIVMLGDVHQFQVMQQYDSIKHKPIVAYAGSLIQQNYGESIDMHGYLKWDVPSRQFEFIEVENEFGFYTIDIEEGKLPDNIDGIPQKPNLRIKYQNTPRAVISDFVNQIRNQRDIQSVKLVCVDERQEYNVEGIQSVDNINDTNYQSSLIRKYIASGNGVYSEQRVQELCQLNEKMNSLLKVTDKYFGTYWRPIRLEWDNMFSYGEGNVVEFDDMKGVVGIVGENGSGKSAIIDVLLFALFDTSSRTTTGQDILNSHKNKFQCKLTFQAGNDIYVIERKGERKGKGSVTIPVNFYKLHKDGSTSSMNGEQRRNTYQNIAKIVGGYDAFVATLASIQNNTSGFVYQGQADRKRFLAELLGVDIFEQLYDVAKQESRSLKSNVDRLRGYNYYYVIEDNENKIQCELNKYNIAEQAKNEAQSQIDSKQQLKESYNRQIVDVESVAYNKESLLQQQQALEQTIQTVTTKKPELLLQESDNQEKLKVLQEALDQMENPSDGYQQYTSAQNELTTAQKKQASMLSSIASDESIIKTLATVEYDPSCNYCMNNALVKDARAKQQALESKRQQLQQIEEDLIAKQEIVDKLAIVVKAKDHYDKMVSATQKLKLLIAEIQKSISQNELQISQTEQQLANITNIIQRYDQIQNTLKTNQEMQVLIQLANNDIANLTQQLKQQEQVLSECRSNIAVFKNVIQAAKNGIEELAENEKQYEVYEQYQAIIGKSGLPYYLIKEAVPAIESTANEILSEIAKFIVRFSLQDNDIDANIVYNNSDDDGWSVALTSGFEKFVIGMAVRLAMSKVSNTARSNFVIIDEGFGAWDVDHLSKIDCVFEYLRSHFGFVIVVSHIDSMRDSMDDVLNVYKDEEGVSHIV